MGVEVIQHSAKIQALIAKHCKYVKIEDLCRLITGDLARRIDLSAQVQLLHSELDADRIDYLLRDAAFSGASYGQFEVGALIKCLAKKPHSQYGAEIVGVEAKGVGPAEQFLISRFMAYSQVIYQKHVAILESMAETAMHWMANESTFGGFPSPSELLDWINRHEQTSSYLEFTDYKFMDALSQVSQKANDCPEPIYMIVEKLKQFRALELAFPATAQGGKLATEIFKTLEATDAFKNLTNDGYLRQNKRIGLVNKVNLTDHVPEQEFVQFYNTMFNVADGVTEDQQPDIKEYLMQRLQSGVAYIADGQEPTLIIDLPFSIIKELSQYTRILLREYVLNP